MRVVALILIGTVLALTPALGKHKRFRGKYCDNRGTYYRTWMPAYDPYLYDPYFYFGWSRLDLPPGLAKRNGRLPPGLQKQLWRRGQLPPGLEKRRGYVFWAF